MRLEKLGFEAVELVTDLSVQHSGTTLSIQLNEAAAPLGLAPQSRQQSGVRRKPKPPASPGGGPVSIAASVRLVGDQIVIRNENDFDWRNVELRVAPFGSVVQISRIRSSGTYSIAISNLSRSARGTRVEQIRVSISCDTPFGKRVVSIVSTRSSAPAS